MISLDLSLIILLFDFFKNLFILLKVRVKGVGGKERQKERDLPLLVIPQMSTPARAGQV